MKQINTKHANDFIHWQEGAFDSSFETLIRNSSVTQNGLRQLKSTNFFVKAEVLI